MILGIDASNIRNGGTVTHLVELLHAATPAAFGFERVVVWGSSALFSRMEDRGWLHKIADPLLEQSGDPFRDRRHLLRFYWQRFRLKRLAEAQGCSVLFVPGGLSTSSFSPIVGMSQNMLPFRWEIARGYGLSASLLRLALLRFGQKKTFRRAVGTLFLTEYARRTITEAAGLSTQLSRVIPHGIGQRFFMAPRAARAIERCTLDRPFNVLYVSTIDLYKHQVQVILAIASLRQRGLPVVLTLAGPANRRALQRMNEVLSRMDSAGEFVKYLGAVKYEEQTQLYEAADVAVFASSCENLPIILLEGMAAGMPIACSNREPMPEVLGDAGIYFDPQRPEQIASAIEQLAMNPELRERKARMAFERARSYSWERCANETFQFFADCANQARRSSGLGHLPSAQNPATADDSLTTR